MICGFPLNCENFRKFCALHCREASHRFSWIIPTAFWVEYYLNFSLICPSFLKLLGLQGQRHLRWELQLTSVNKSKLPNPKNVWSSHELCFIMRLTYLFDIHKTNGRRTLEYLITVHKHVRTELFHCHVEHSNWCKNPWIWLFTISSPSSNCPS